MSRLEHTKLLDNKTPQIVLSLSRHSYINAIRLPLLIDSALLGAGNVVVE
jgi:hypothetical protein